MERQDNTLKFTWEGDAKGKDSALLTLTVDNIAYELFNYSEGCSFSITLPQKPNDEIKIEYQKNPDSKKHTCVKGMFEFPSQEDYDCLPSGKVSRLSGLALQVCPNMDLKGVETKPKCRNNLAVATASFAFPIYGIYNAMRSHYNRTAVICGAAFGFGIAMLFSSIAKSHYDEIGTGVGHHAIFTYDPFSVTDIIINLLIGGISSIRGLLYYLLS
ncbi:MAG: hypothetical protein NC402_08005 [Prevotella sp.]|nr:hypothetical protein [Prevotella sp.]MCM1075674.1 hypothetical protein [Ruminococcus sp.]